MRGYFGLESSVPIRRHTLKSAIIAGTKAGTVWNLAAVPSDRRKFTVSDKRKQFEVWAEDLARRSACGFTEHTLARDPIAPDCYRQSWVEAAWNGFQGGCQALKSQSQVMGRVAHMDDGSVICYLNSVGRGLPYNTALYANSVDAKDNANH